MSDARRPPRILLILGPTSPSQHALATAVAVAARLSAELHPLFVEEEELLRAAALPFARHVTRTGHIVEAFNERAIREKWRSLMTTSDAAIRDAARRLGVPVRFEVARGPRKREVERASAATEMVMFASARTPEIGHVLPTREPNVAGARVCVFSDGGPSAERALEIARLLAGPENAPEVWTGHSVSDAPGHLWASGSPSSLRVQELSRSSVPDLLRLLWSASGATLVLPEDGWLTQTLIDLSMNAVLPCWIVLIR